MSADDMLFDANQEVLGELEDLLYQITPEDYSTMSPVFRTSSIGQHCRHIIELYHCLLDQYGEGMISYDRRKRDLSIETDIVIAISHIKNIRQKINLPDKSITLLHRIGEEDSPFESSYFREVLYNLEHCIHHQALIKLACQHLDYIHLPMAFGIARSTLAFKKEG